MQINKINTTSLYVKADDKLDISTAMDFGAAVNDELDGISDLVLDFENVVYISSIGLRVILELQKRMKTQGKMKLTNVSPQVMDTFTMTGFNNILTII